MQKYTLLVIFATIIQGVDIECIAKLNIITMRYVHFFNHQILNKFEYLNSY